ncbi:MAG: LysR family transcriptional regulator [Polyangiaceae bacterium]
MLDELRHLLLIVEHRTFTAAARHAHLSQPALSASVRRLEEELGARLLDRGRHGATLTAEGEALLPRAQAALAAFEDGRRAVEEVAGLSVGEVTIGAGATVSTYLLPPLLSRYRKKYPGIRIVLREMSTEPAKDAIAEGSLDLAIVDTWRGRRAGIDKERWREDRFILVASSADADPLGPMVTFKRGTTTRAMVDRHFASSPIVMELSSIAAVKGHVREGIGVALVAETAVERDLARGQLVTLRHRRTPLRRRLVLAHRGVDRLPPAAHALRRILLAARS